MASNNDDGLGNLTALYFKIEYQGKQLPFRLPAKPNEVYQALFAGMIGEYRYKDQRMEKAKDCSGGYANYALKSN